MKRYLYIIFIVLSLITLSSCSFVNYVKEESSSDETIEQERKNYKYDLESISNDSLYNEEERKLYMDYIVEAKAEINECDSIDGIKEIFDRYSILIKALKTIEDYNNELLDMKNKYIDLLKAVSSSDNYREDELALYNQCISHGTESINSIKYAQESVFEQVYNVYKEAILAIKTKSEYEKEEKDLQEEKDKYISLLRNVSSTDLYREVESETFSFYLNNGINTITNEDNIKEIEKIYNAYKDIILSIKTSAQYEAEEAIALAKYKEDNIEIINNYVDIELYRTEEVNTIESYIDEYTTKINNSTTNSEIDNYVIDYKVNVYPLKTDKELYEEELELLINNSISEISNYKLLSKYRTNEVIIINQMILSFNKQVVLLTTKEAVNDMVDEYKQMLDSIKDDETLYKEELVVLVNESYDELLTLVNLNDMTEEAQNEYLEYCLNVKNEMLELTIKEDVKSRLNSEKQTIYILGAQLGDKNSLMEFQELLAENLSNYLDSSLYRNEQQVEILTTVNTQGKNIKKAETYNDTLLAEESAHQALDAILTNDQMWLKEDDDFFVNLHTLYGDNILTPPASMTVANDYYELAKIIDYYAFYQLDSESFIRDKFRVKLNWEHKSATYEKREVYWYCDLIRFAVGIDVSMEDEDYLIVKLIPYDFASGVATSSNPTKYDSVTSLDYSGTETTRDATFDDFKYKENDKSVICWNSQQLWYALENGYMPVCTSNSKAEEILNASKDILRSIIKEGMTDFQKVFEIYRWCGLTWEHDDSFFAYWYSSDYDEYPDENYSTRSSGHAEGGILYNSVICASAAKAMLILLRMEGIESLRILEEHPGMSSTNTINGRSFGTNGSHEVVYVKLGEEWYYCDPLYAIELVDVPSFLRILLPTVCEPWVSKNKKGIITTQYNYDNYKAMQYSGLSVFVENESELDTLITLFENDTSGMCINILYNPNTFDANSYYKNNYNYEYKNLVYYLGELVIYPIN